MKHEGGLQGYKPPASRALALESDRQSIAGMPNVVSVCAGGCAWASRLSRWKSCRVPGPGQNFTGSGSSPQRLSAKLRIASSN